MPLTVLILSDRRNVMPIETRAEADRWSKPTKPQEPTEPGYDEWLATEITEGLAELDAGKGIPAGDIWRDLGLE